MTFITKTALKERGWSAKLIQEFFPSPDGERPNRRHPSCPPAKLYRRDRVEQAEASPRYHALRAAADVRRRAVAKVQERQRDRLMRSVESVNVDLPDLPRRELVQEACDHYNGVRLPQEENPWATPATPASDPLLLDRITVSYLLYCLSNFGIELARMAGKVGRREASWALKRRVLTAIAEKFPWLAEECERQAGDPFLWEGEED
jgi:hypothetical protein